ncbi:MAG: hypothetical protein ACI9PP_000452 [Halobacteriales archaeon]|jgi:hypothetical protein
MDDEAYDGLIGAFPYAVRSSESWVFRSYVFVGGLASVLAALLFLFGIIAILGETSVASSGALSLTQAFFVVVALGVIVPLLAPVLFVARQHRKGLSTDGYDLAMGAVGYGFLVSLYVALIVSVPPNAQEPTGGALGPLVEFLYDLPQWAGVIPMAVAAAAILLLHRFAAGRSGAGEADADGGTS